MDIIPRFKGTAENHNPSSMEGFRILLAKVFVEGTPLALSPAVCHVIT